jgi:transketolase
MLEAISQQHSEKPLAVLAKTIKGKGVSFMENNNAWHHSVLKDKEYQQAVEEVMQKYGSC